jgi:multidrug efflux pump
VSLSVTPMICAYFVRQPPSRDATWLDRWVEGLLSRMIRFYDRTLTFALAHRALMLIVFVATIVLTIGLYIKVPKGYFPQDDTGLIFGGTEASTDISYESMVDLQRKATEVVLADPALRASARQSVRRHFRRRSTAAACSSASNRSTSGAMSARCRWWRGCAAS